MKTNKIYCMGCKELLPKLENVDMIFIDPPFGINFKENTTRIYSQGLYKSQVPKEIYYEDFSDEKEYSEWSKSWIKLAYNCLKEEGVLVLVSGWSNVSYLDLNCREVGFKILNHCIWKYEFGVFCSKKFTTSHYHILVYIKTKDIKKRRFTFNQSKKYMEDVILNIRRTDKKKFNHPCSMTTKLPEYFIKIFSNEGEFIIDFFAGVGGTLVACANLRRKFIGCDINSEYCKIANERVKKELSQTKL